MTDAAHPAAGTAPALETADQFPLSAYWYGDGGGGATTLADAGAVNDFLLTRGARILAAGERLLITDSRGDGAYLEIDGGRVIWAGEGADVMHFEAMLRRAFPTPEADQTRREQAERVVTAIFRDLARSPGLGAVWESVGAAAGGLSERAVHLALAELGPAPAAERQIVEAALESDPFAAGQLLLNARLLLAAGHAPGDVLNYVKRRVREECEAR